MLNFIRQNAGDYTATTASGATYRVYRSSTSGRVTWMVSRNGDAAEQTFPTFRAAEEHANGVAVLNGDNDAANAPEAVIVAVAEESGLSPEAAEAVVPAAPRRRGRRTTAGDGSPVTEYTPAEEAEIAEAIEAAAAAPVIDADAQFTLIPEHRPEGELQNVPTSRVRPGRVQGAPEELIDSVRRFGILQPLALVRRADGGYDIADGRRRYAAAVAAELGAAPALVFPEGTPAALAAAITLTTNMQRQPNPPSELEAIERMVHEGANIEQIAQELRLSTFVIRRRMALARLIPEFRELLEDGTLSVTTAQRVARHPESEQRDLLRTFRETGRITSDDRAARRRARRGEQADAVPEVAPVGSRYARAIVELRHSGHHAAADYLLEAGRADQDAEDAPDNDAEAERVDPVPAAPATPEAALPAGHGWAVVLTCLQRAEDSVPVSPDDHTDGFYADLSALMMRVQRIVNAQAA